MEYIKHGHDDPNYVDHALIGTIDFSTAGNCKIEVYGKEGSIPHFHITNKSINFECCLCIYEPLYFNHGSKTDKLSKKELKILDTWLREKNDEFTVYTRWEVICILWKMSENPSELIPKILIQPHYEDTVNMIDCKGEYIITDYSKHGHDDPDYMDRAVIGIIDFSTVDNVELSEQLVEPFKGRRVGACKVEVHGKEGHIPHFHVIGNSFECCICIYEPLYFNHGYKTDKLNSRELKELDIWLREKDDIFTAYTRWEIICYNWKTSENSMKLVPKNPVQPHYEDTVNIIN